MEEMKNEVMEQGAVQEESYKSGSVHYIDSREVARMVEKEHSNLLKDIRRYITQMGKVKIDFSEFFIESLYRVEGQSREYPCYLVTEKGCEFIAHKMTSEKGTAFTVAYIDRFHEMKSVLEGKGELDKFCDVIKEYMIHQSKREQQQEETIQATIGLVSQVKERLERLETQRVGILSWNPFSVQQDVIDQRMRTLNGLIDQVADLCQMERNKVLHFLYKTMQECLGVTLNPYLAVMKSEQGDESICNFHVIASVDRFYEKAVEMCRDVIARKRLFG